MNTQQQATEMNSGNQRLSLAQLQAYESLAYGMFIHFGMSTFDGIEKSWGDKPSSFYAPDQLDVKQWISVARDAGMKYSVLTAKHHSGHCLWPTKYSDYHVGTSSNKTDVVAEFVQACEQTGVKPGLYYCSWDNHHLFGSVTANSVALAQAWTSQQYQEFQWKQIEELLTQYGSIAQVWIDIPGVLPREYRNRLYQHIAALQPQAIITANSGLDERLAFDAGYAWPTDVVVVERSLPNCFTARKWWEVEGQQYYLPLEMADTISREWMYFDDDPPHSDMELLGAYLTNRARGANYLLNVPPDRRGLIPQMHIDALTRLQNNIEKLDGVGG